MAERDWLNQNNVIAYPLVTREDRTFIGVGELPASGIADAGFMLGLDSGFVPGTHEVHLYAIFRSATRVLFDFRCDAAPMADYRWVFELPDDTPDNCTLTATVTDISTVIPSPDRGEGFIVIADPTELRALSFGMHTMTTPLPVEPALLQSLVNTFARGVSVANDARVCPDNNCGSSDSSSSGGATADTYPFVLNLTGDIQFREGNNLNIEILAEDNSIRLKARRRQGLGEPCEDIIIDEDGFRRGDECTNCDGFISSFNGVAMGKDVRLTLGPGVAAIRFPDLNKIQIKTEINRSCEQ